MIYKNVELYNVYELVEIGKEKNIISRIPDVLRKHLKQNEYLQTRALMPDGCEIRFNLKSDIGKIMLQAKDKGAGGIYEIYQGNFFHSFQWISDEITTITLKREDLLSNSKKLKILTEKNGLPFDPILTRIILPRSIILKIVDIEGNFDIPEKEQVPSIKYLSYGSSITQGQSAIRPTGSYVMRTAQLLGVDLINLGFGGGAHLEKEMADYIAEKVKWNFATLEMGINMLYNFEVEEFKKRVEYFIPTIKEKNPDKYIFCIDIFTFGSDFFDDCNGKEKKFREIVKKTVESLNNEKVIYIPGTEILKNVDGLGVDLVHPSPSGMEEIAWNLSSIIKPKIKQENNI